MRELSNETIREIQEYAFGNIVEEMKQLDAEERLYLIRPLVATFCLYCGENKSECKGHGNGTKEALQV